VDKDDEGEDDDSPAAAQIFNPQYQLEDIQEIEQEDISSNMMM